MAKLCMKVALQEQDGTPLDYSNTKRKSLGSSWWQHGVGQSGGTLRHKDETEQGCSPKKATATLEVRNHRNRVWLASQKTVLSRSVESVPHGQGRAVDVLHNCFLLTLHCYFLDYFSHPFVETHHTGTIRPFSGLHHLVCIMVKEKSSQCYTFCH